MIFTQIFDENAKPTPHGFDVREVHKVLDSSFVKVKEWEKETGEIERKRAL